MKREFFEKDAITSIIVHPNKVIPALKIGNTEYTWKPVNSEGETIDFTKLVGQYNYAVAYALAVKLKWKLLQKY